MAPITPLYAPSRYFENRSSVLGLGTGVFVLYLALQMLWLDYAIPLLLEQATNIDPQLEYALVAEVPRILAVSAIGLCIAWVVVAAIMHYGSGGSKSSGSFTDALGVAGWAYAPEVVLFLPGVLYSWRTIQGYSFDGSDPQQLVSEVEAVSSQSVLEPIPILLVFVTTVWSIYILTHGVSKTHDVRLETTMGPATVVGAGSILLWLVS